MQIRITSSGGEKSQKNKIIILTGMKYSFIVVLAVIVIIFWPKLRGLTANDIISYAPNSLVLAFFVFMLIFIVKSLTFVMPLIVIYLAAGIVFPPVTAALVCLCGLLCGATVMFHAGRFFGSDAVMKLSGKNKLMRGIMKYPGKGGAGFIFIIRLIPVFPADFVSLFWGASGSKFWPFIKGSVFGYLPGIIPFIIVGNDSLDIRSPRFIAALIAYIVIMISVLVYYFKVKPRISG